MADGKTVNYFFKALEKEDVSSYPVSKAAVVTLHSLERRFAPATVNFLFLIYSVMEIAYK